MSGKLDKLLAETRDLDAQVSAILEGDAEPAGPPPDPPAHLDDTAAAKWRELAAAGGEINVGDLDLLTLYCVAWSRWKESEGKVAELGTIVRSPSGFPCQSPYLSVANKALEQVLKIGKRLGLPQ